MAETLPFDLTDLDNFADGFPHDLFARHRRDAPVCWHAPTEHTPDGQGFWSVATYEHVDAVLNDSATYSSETGGDRPYGGTLIQDLPIAGTVLNMMDDPRRQRVRRLVNIGLTPREVQDLGDELRRRTRVLLDAVDDGATIDFLTQVAVELPMQTICILLGIPEGDRHELFECVEHVFDSRNDTASFDMSDTAVTAQHWMFEYGANLIAERRRHPGDDMLSLAVTATLADVDPPALTDNELFAFFILLFSAGSETTRNAVTLEAPHRNWCDRARRPFHRARRQGGGVGGVGEPRRGCLRSTDGLRHRTWPEPAPRVRP